MTFFNLDTFLRSMGKVWGVVKGLMGFGLLLEPHL